MSLCSTQRRLWLAISQFASLHRGDDFRIALQRHRDAEHGRAEVSIGKDPPQPPEAGARTIFEHRLDIGVTPADKGCAPSTSERNASDALSPCRSCSRRPPRNSPRIARRCARRPASADRAGCGHSRGDRGDSVRSPNSSRRARYEASHHPLRAGHGKDQSGHCSAAIARELTSARGGRLCGAQSNRNPAMPTPEKNTRKRAA